ncbi:hypothetical protein NVS47_07660 [Dehalobacterium formicoaceticum]|uniref:Uncharacterized protein n=1 Tax=Dehalobacterium formicoaceticum TaxID=51515 RepID=A0ABT1Y3E1_9FIRM|nr:hypothetical protein [Dehalobacterium formicoaceticum]MCR6545391.1 hypothetical protein [Dehalobacterium formicoaceticum]
MWEINALLLFIALYFFVSLGRVWRAWKVTQSGEKRVLILLFHNCGRSAERVMWDMLRLKSWYDHDLSFLVIDDHSQDDTLLVLTTVRKKVPFTLLPTRLGKKIAAILLWQGKNVHFLLIGPEESPKTVRRKILALLNQDQKRRKSNKRLLL